MLDSLYEWQIYSHRGLLKVSASTEGILFRERATQYSGVGRTDALLNVQRGWRRPAMDDVRVFWAKPGYLDLL